MANELVNPVAVLQESLMRWENNIILFKQVNREFDDKFAVPNEKIGYTVNARMPVRFRGRIGDAAQPEDIQETLVPVTINRLWGQDLNISDQDLTLTIDRFGERYIEGSSSIIANLMDGEGFDNYNQYYNFVGTPGTIPGTLATYATSRAALARAAVPMGSRAMIIDPDMEVNALGFQNNLFNPQDEIGRQYSEGTMGKAIGFKWSMAQNVSRHTTGNFTGSTPLVVAAPAQNATSITTNGWLPVTTGTLKKGEIVQFTGCNSINPASWRDTGKLANFVLTQDAAVDGTGATTLNFQPPMNSDPTSPFQTVTALPVANAAILVWGKAAGAALNAIAQVSSSQGFAFHKDALTIAVVPMELPGGMDWSERINNNKIGMSMRLIRGFDIKSNTRITRLDVLGGWKALRQDWLVRVASA